MEKDNTLGENLKRAREKSPYTQEEVAQVLKIKRQTYSAYERGVSIPDALTLKTLAELFHISTDSLLNYFPTQGRFTDYHKIIFKENLTHLMRLHDKTESDLAKSINVQKSTLSCWCKGDRLPTIPGLQKLTDYFKVSPDDLTQEPQTKDSYVEPEIIRIIGKNVAHQRSVINLSRSDLNHRLGSDYLEEEIRLRALEAGTVSYITSRKLKALAKALCTTTEFLTDESPESFHEDFIISDVEKDLLNHYQSLNDDNRKVLHNYIDFMLSNQ